MTVAAVRGGPLYRRQRADRVDRCRHGGITGCIGADDGAAGTDARDGGRRGGLPLRNRDRRRCRRRDARIVTDERELYAPGRRLRNDHDRQRGCCTERDVHRADDDCDVAGYRALENPCGVARR